MDTQLKKGLLEICVLKSLEKEDSYGYKIIQDLKDYVDISESTLYPILKRLELNKFLGTYSKEYNSRLRKYYKITKSGKERINDFVHEWQGIERIYQFILGEEHNE